MADTASSMVLPEGTKLTVTLGSQRLQAVQYNSFEVGPFSIEMTAEGEETALALYQRGKAMLSEMASLELQSCLEEHLDSIRIAGAAAKRGARG